MKYRIVFSFAGMMFILLLLGSGIVHAFNVDDVEAIKKTNTCVACDLSGADLSGLNLHMANLSGSNLSYANLSNANLSNAWLTDANLTNANLSKTDLSGATLDGAIWTDGKRCADGSMGICNK